MDDFDLRTFGDGLRHGDVDVFDTGTQVSAPAPVNDVAAKVEQFTELRTAYDLEMAAMLRARDEVLAKVQGELEAITEEFAPRLAEADEKLRALEAEIKTEVLKAGATCKGRRWEFRYVSGKRTVPVKDLETLAKVKGDTSLLKIIKQGDPSVAVYEVK